MRSIDRLIDRSLWLKYIVLQWTVFNVRGGVTLRYVTLRYGTGQHYSITEVHLYGAAKLPDSHLKCNAG